MLDLHKIDALLAARKPFHTLPRALYNDPDVFAFDTELIFGSSWILAGFSCEVAAPRSTLAVTIAQSPIVLTRDREGVLRGFFNACRHRGAKVCLDGAAHHARLVCPYHQWVYDLDGRLVSARAMGKGFDKARYGLKPIHVEEVAGAIFVCLADTPPPFEAFRSQLEPMLAPHALHEAKIAHASTLVERGNWKLVMENARECYHCAAGHPELALTFPIQAAVGDSYAASGDAFHREFAQRMGTLNLPCGPDMGSWWHFKRIPLRNGAHSLTLDGQPAVAKLMVDTPDTAIGSLRWAIEPHSFCHSTVDTTVMFSAMPTAPNETVVTCKWLVHRDAVEGVDYDVEHLTKLWTVTNLQDRDLVENNQLGVNAIGYEPGPYCVSHESYVVRFVEWYCAAAREQIARKLEQSVPAWSAPLVARADDSALAVAAGA